MRFAYPGYNIKIRKRAETSDDATSNNAPATEAEREQLAHLARKAGGKAKRLKEGIENALVLWAAMIAWLEQD